MKKKFFLVALGALCTFSPKITAGDPHEAALAINAKLKTNIKIGDDLNPSTEQTDNFTFEIFTIQNALLVKHIGFTITSKKDDNVLALVFMETQPDGSEQWLLYNFTLKIWVRNQKLNDDDKAREIFAELQKILPPQESPDEH